jgi:hypothetical protein
VLHPPAGTDPDPGLLHISGGAGGHFLLDEERLSGVLSAAQLETAEADAARGAGNWSTATEVSFMVWAPRKPKNWNYWRARMSMSQQEG